MTVPWDELRGVAAVLAIVAAVGAAVRWVVRVGRRIREVEAACVKAKRELEQSLADYRRGRDVALEHVRVHHVCLDRLVGAIEFLVSQDKGLGDPARRRLGATLVEAKKESEESTRRIDLLLSDRWGDVFGALAFFKSQEDAENQEFLREFLERMDERTILREHFAEIVGLFADRGWVIGFRES